MNSDNLFVDNWEAIEKKYFDKVVKKNEFFPGQELLTHYFTVDNLEMLLVKIFDSWDDIEKASFKEDELIKAARPDEKLRTVFFDKRQAYYAPNHSEEICRSYVGVKIGKENINKLMLFYV